MDPRHRSRRPVAAPLVVTALLVVALAAPSALAQEPRKPSPVPVPRPLPLPRPVPTDRPVVVPVPLELPSTDRLHFTFVTGDDDLRSSSWLRVRVLHVDGTVLTPISEGVGPWSSLHLTDRATLRAGAGSDWRNGSVHRVEVALNRRVPLADIAGVEFDLRQGRCDNCTTDHWELDRLEIRAGGADGAVLVERSGDPLWRTDSGGWARSVYGVPLNPDRSPGPGAITALDVEVRTGRDDLANAYLHLHVFDADGERLSSTTLNELALKGAEGHRWDRNELVRRTVQLQRPVAASEFGSLELYLEQTASMEAFFDNWDLREITVRDAAGGALLVRHGARRFTGTDNTLVVPFE